MKRKRLSETDDEALHRKDVIKSCMKRKQSSHVTFDNAISAFISKIQCGPDYV